ncbi:MAG TPA: hypothetical protein VF236_08455 [Gaiellaceae bacterium]
MTEHVKISQQQEDTQTQKDLTARVGVRLETPQKSTTSRWSAVKRLLRTA